MTQVGTQLPVSVGFTANVAGLAGIVISAVGARGEAAVADQLGWLTIGIIGLLIALTADLAIVFAGRKKLGVRRSQLVQLPRGSAISPALDSPGASDLVTVSGGRRFHRPDCLLVAGKAAVDDARAELDRGGITPCGVCRP